MALALTLLEVRSQKGTEIYVTATYLSLDNRNDGGQDFFLRVSITSLVQLLKLNHQIICLMYLTDIFETGAHGVPSKSQNLTILGQGGPSSTQCSNPS